MSDKLLTLKEASECLRLTENEVRALVKEGKVTAYHVGGVYLRFKEEEIFSLRGKYGRSIQAADTRNEKEKTEEAACANTFISGIRDFFYFNDFYLFAAAVTAFLIYIILKSIR